MYERVVCAGPARFMCTVGYGHLCGGDTEEATPSDALLTRELTVTGGSGMVVPAGVQSPVNPTVEDTGDQVQEGSGEAGTKDLWRV